VPAAFGVEGKRRGMPMTPAAQADLRAANEGDKMANIGISLELEFCCTWRNACDLTWWRLWACLRHTTWLRPRHTLLQCWMCSGMLGARHHHPDMQLTTTRQREMQLVHCNDCGQLCSQMGQGHKCSRRTRSRRTRTRATSSAPLSKASVYPQ
jgi:hypothetical protein